MKNYKRALCIILASSGILLLSACRQDKSTDSSVTSSSLSSQESAASQAEPTSDTAQSSAEPSDTEENRIKAEIQEKTEQNGFGGIDDTTLDKLSRLRKNMTKEQVHEVLGDPDSYPPTGIYREQYYINENSNKYIEVVILSDGITVYLVDSELKNSVIIL